MEQIAENTSQMNKTFTNTQNSTMYEQIKLPTPHKNKKIFESTSTYVALSKKRIPWSGWLQNENLQNTENPVREVFNIEHMTINHKARVNGFCKIHQTLYLINGVVANTAGPVKIDFECLNVSNMVRVLIFSGILENHILFGKYRVCHIDSEDAKKMDISVPELTKGIFEVELNSATFEGLQVVLSENEFVQVQSYDFKIDKILKKKYQTYVRLKSDEGKQ